MTTQFDRETSLRQVADNRWQPESNDYWGGDAVASGGYSHALAIKAIGLCSEHPHPATATSHYLRPLVPGLPSEIEVEVMQKSRRVTTARAILRQNDKPCLLTTASYIELDTHFGIEGERRPAPPVLPDPQACIDTSQEFDEADGEGPRGLFSRIEVRVTQEHASAEGHSFPDMAGWVRFRDGSSADTLVPHMFLDTFPPAIFGEIGYIAWVPTIEFTTHLHRQPAPGWLQGQFAVEVLSNGRMIESGWLWDSEGELVADSRQIAMVMTDT